jgi:mRNA interferase MazF
MEIRRGDLLLVDFDPSTSDDSRRAKTRKAGSEIFKVRPAVVLSINALNRGRKTVVVIPLSSAPRAAPPVLVAVPSAGEGSVAVCDQITAVNRATRVKRKLGTVSVDDMVRLEHALAEILHIGARATE